MNTAMRRADRAVTELADIMGIVQRCTVCRIALQDLPAPYIVPLSYGYEWEGDRLRLYFHCAGEGRKLELIAKHPVAGFEMDGGERLIAGPNACDYTTEYESVIGHGTIRVLESPADKQHALTLLMAHCEPGREFGEIPPRMLDAVCCLRLDCEALSAKRNKK